jgi:hypothetical protein
MLVGSPYANQPNGRLYAFSGSAASYSYLQYITPSDSNVTNFGLGVALDRSGSTAFGRGSSSNFAYCSFTKTGPNWFAGPEIMTSDSGGFGVDSGVLAVGGQYAETMFAISSSSSQVLKPADFTPSPSNGTFGTPLAISGNTVLIAGSPLDSQGLNGHYGYVFLNSGSTWVQQAKLVPSDLATTSALNFEFTVALDGTTAVLASSLGAYVFAQSGSTWAQVQKIPTPSGAPGFGSAVDLSGNLLVITGAPLGGTTGVAYVYARANGSWLAGPVLSSGTDGDDYGYSVGVSQGTVAVGAPAGDGAVYVYSCQPSQ